MSDAFNLALATGHEIVVDAYVKDQAGIPHQLAVSDGGVDIDATAAIRRTCKQVTVVDPSLTPTGSTSLLDPASGNEITLRRGIKFPSGAVEMYPLGVFGITQAETTEDATTGAPSVVLSGSDRGQAISDSPWDYPYQVIAGDGGTAIKALITNRAPGTVFNFAPTTGLNVPGLLYGTGDNDNDPWAAAQQMALSIGHSLFFDAAGVCTLRPILDVTTAPIVWRVGDGELVKPLEIQTTRQRARSYNRVVAVAQSTTIAAPLRSVASTGATPTRTFFYGTSAALTQSQLDVVAAALLRAFQGSYQSVQFDVIPDPRVDVDQKIWVQRPSVGVAGSHILSKISLGLTPASRMTATVLEANAA